MLPIVMRPMRSNDINFVMNCWLNDSAKQYPNKYAHYKNFNVKQSKNLLNVLQHCNVLVAVSPEDDDFIFGFVAYEQDNSTTVFHFVYVKDTYRNQKIAKRLLTYVFPNLAVQDCIITHLPKLDDANYEKYQLLNEADLERQGRELRYANVIRFYLMANHLFYDPFIFQQRCFK